MLTRIELGPLSLADAGAFLGHGVDPGRTSSLYETSGGNPFYLQQLARTLGLEATTGGGTVELSEAIEVPPAVASALSEELASLSPAARLVLEGAAVAVAPQDGHVSALALADHVVGPAAEGGWAGLVDVLDGLG